MMSARSARLVGLVAVVAIAGAGCIGATSRSELEKKVRERGGGISRDLVLDAIDALGDAQGTDAVRLVTVTAMNNRVTLEARVPDRPEEYDVYTYGTSGLFGENGLSSAQPGTRSAGDAPIEARVFGRNDVAIDRLNDMLDTALAGAALDAGYVERVVIARRAPGADVIVVVTVTDDRRSVDVLFAADGSIVEAPAA